MARCWTTQRSGRNASWSNSILSIRRCGTTFGHFLDRGRWRVWDIRLLGGCKGDLCEIPKRRCLGRFEGDETGDSRDDDLLWGTGDRRDVTSSLKEIGD